MDVDASEDAALLAKLEADQAAVDEKVKDLLAREDAAAAAEDYDLAEALAKERKALPRTAVARRAFEAIEEAMEQRSSAALEAAIGPPTSELATRHGTLAAASAQLAEYFAGDRVEFDLPLDLIGTDFQKAAWLALTDVPYGETSSYGEQAERIGRTGAFRAIGAANGKNPIPIVLPCHRIVGADGSLTGFAGGLEMKQRLLALEQAQQSFDI